MRDTWNNWASDVLRDNSDALAIIITHWLTDSPAYLSNSERGLCEHDNVFMAIEGHSHGTRYRKIIDCGGGHRVERHQFSLPHGREERNEAAARLYTFDLAAEEVCYESRHVFENRWLREQGGCTPPCNTGSCHCDEWCIELPPPPR